MVLRLLSIVCVLLLLSTTVMAAESYTLGRAPQLSPSIISDTWSPFVKYLADTTGKDIRLKIYKTRDVFEQDIKRGVLDFYYGNPGYGIVGHERFGYQALIRSDSKPLRGIIVVRADSGITSLKQLDGKDIIFPSQNAFAASRILRAYLKKREKLNFIPRYSNTHDNVYRAVAIGDFIAGGGVERTLASEPKQLQSSLRVLYTTPDLAPHPLMAHPRVPEDLQRDIRQAILNLKNSQDGKQMLDKVKIRQPIIPDYQNEYAPLSDLTHEIYSHLF